MNRIISLIGVYLPCMRMLINTILITFLWAIIGFGQDRLSSDTLIRIDVKPAKGFSFIRMIRVWYMKRLPGETQTKTRLSCSIFLFKSEKS
jgi:hypothetical protein